MRAAILCLAMMLASGARATPPASDSSQDPKAPTKDLVSAAKDAKGKRKQPSTKVLTNADVKKSKGKLIVLSSTEKAEPETVAKEVDPLTPMQRHDATYRERLVTDEKTRVAQARVDALEKELLELESRYYEENDPDRRDRVIRSKFEEVRKSLDEAKAELEAVRPKDPEPET
ncbi:MAG TPA: hypothetical protein VFM36_02345 [Thermoanaerobaculia bacterium]|nr:hypothetical protein [Thermoanaerobaculia bacterium]